MRRAYLLALLLASCKDDPPESTGCPSDRPDFQVLVTALDAPLPADTLISIDYGAGGREYYSYPDRFEHNALFCTPSDREGNPLPEGGQGGQGPGAIGAGGEGASSGIEGIFCDLWTDGPATMTVESALYPTETADLHAKKGKCVLATEIVLGPDDGGT